MTRENKLALIVGFSIILVVGVLVSDHFSQARMAELDPVDDAAQVAGADRGVPDPLAERYDTPRRSSTPARVEDPGVGLLSNAVAQHERQASTETLALDDPDPLRPTRDPLESAAPSRPPVVIRQGPYTSAPDSGDDALTRLLAAAREADVPLTVQPSRSLSISPETKRDVSRPSAPLPPEYGEYAVEKGDSLYSIAKRFMGSGEKWQELKSINEDRLTQGQTLWVGMRLRVPAPSIGPAPTPAKPASATKTSSNAPTRDYVIQDGDTLGEVAQRELGSAKRMGEILELNKDRIADADAIYVGMKLRLPAR